MAELYRKETPVGEEAEDLERFRARVKGEKC